MACSCVNSILIHGTYDNEDCLFYEVACLRDHHDEDHDDHRGDLHVAEHRLHRLVAYDQLEACSLVEACVLQKACILGVACDRLVACILEEACAHLVACAHRGACALAFHLEEDSNLEVACHLVVDIGRQEDILVVGINLEVGIDLGVGNLVRLVENVLTSLFLVNDLF